MTWRNYIVGVADATTQKLYVNWVLVSSVNTNHASVTDTTHELQIGKNYNNQYFSWQIDEVRIRNRALSSWEIQQMRRSNFQKFDVDKWRLTDDRQCMISNTGYIYTWYVANVALNATTGRINNINIANRNPTAPTGYSLGSTWFSNSIVSLSWQFTGFYTVEDRKGTSWRYTTFQLPMRLTWLTYSSNYIDRTNIFFMATGLNVIAGNGNSSIYVTWTLGTYQTGNTPKTYMVRDTVTTPQYSCPSGIYGNKPFIRVDIPANTTPDTYSWILNMILYE